MSFIKNLRIAKKIYDIKREEKASLVTYPIKDDVPRFIADKSCVTVLTKKKGVRFL